MDTTEKTEAIALRIIPFSRTSHVVTWLTPDRGKLTTIVKGSVRPKSLFLGQYDLFYTCELVFYLHERNGAHIARECSPVKTRSALRDNWKNSAIASYICDFVSHASVTGGHEADLYELLDGALDFLCGTSAKPQFLFWFELRLARNAGFSPRFTSCAACDSELKESATVVFSASRGGMLCSRCAQLFTDNAIKVPGGIAAMLRYWHDTGSPAASQNTRCSAADIRNIDKILGMFLLYHLDTNIMLRSRRIAIGMANF
jgi:DNA repair protein RecO (recombination protein O)